VYRSVSVRIDGILAVSEREAVSRAIAYPAGRLLSWSARPDIPRTYAMFVLPVGYDAVAIAGALPAGARVHDPALVVLEIVAEQRRCSQALEHALCGAGRLSGIVDTVRTGSGMLVELDCARTPLSLLIDLIDVELAHAPGRAIVPLLPIDDTVLAAMARDLLGDPALDVSRLIETYTEAL
jgi:hypothetical protein